MNGINPLILVAVAGVEDPGVKNLQIAFWLSNVEVGAHNQHLMHHRLKGKLVDIFQGCRLWVIKLKNVQKFLPCEVEVRRVQVALAGVTPNKVMLA